MIAICMTPAYDAVSLREALAHWRAYYKADPALLIVPRELVGDLIGTKAAELTEAQRTFRFDGIPIVSMADWWEAEAGHYGELDAQGIPAQAQEMVGSGATTRALRQARIYLEVEMQTVDYFRLTPEERESPTFMRRWFTDRRWWQQRQGTNP